MHKIKTLIVKLKDARSKRVMFVSHCLLNENTRYLGGAMKPAGVNEIIDELQRKDIGIVQMPCPEQRAWGGVLKRKMLRGYDLNHSLLKWFRKPYMSYFVWMTKRLYSGLTHDIANQIEDYTKSGFEVVGIIGVKGSPSCGVSRSLDLEKSSDFLANLEIDKLNPDDFNENIYKADLVDWEGLFIKALKQSLWKKQIKIKFLEFDLLKEVKKESTEFKI